jgi:selenocysteine lyase/cysteine desulfurase
MLTAETRARDFPSLAGMTYLNTAAEGIPPKCVGDALQEYWRDKLKGMKGRDDHFARLERCREIAARWLKLAPSEVSFCSCSSEACNLLASALNLKRRDEVVVNDLEYPSSVTPWLTSATPVRMRLWKARDGAVAIEDLLPLLNRNTRLVAVSLVSFYNGFRLAWRPFLTAVRAHAPQAIVSVDVTQALCRCVLDVSDADFIFSSTHKWTLGLHGGCIVGIPQRGAERLTARAGGWFHIANAFESDRFQRATLKPGAASFSVGMPSFGPIYALDASLRYLEAIGIKAIAQHADPLVGLLQQGLIELGVKPMAPLSGSGIVSFQHPESAEIHADLRKENIHVMHHAGRIRISLHGYNMSEDVGRLLETLRIILAQRRKGAKKGI